MDAECFPLRVSFWSQFIRLYFMSALVSSFAYQSGENEDILGSFVCDLYKVMAQNYFVACYSSLLQREG